MRLLGRRPSRLQLAVFRRLRSLLAACDRPDCYFIPPGRSGPELIARLVELQKFAAKEEVFNPDPDVGHAGAKPAPKKSIDLLPLRSSMPSILIDL